MKNWDHQTGAKIGSLIGLVLGFWLIWYCLDRLY